MRKTFDCVVYVASRICFVAGIFYLGEAIYEKGKRDGVRQICETLEEIVDKYHDSKDKGSV